MGRRGPRPTPTPILNHHLPGILDRRQAGRLGLRGQDRPALGRGERQGGPVPHGTRRQGNRRRLLLRRQPTAVRQRGQNGPPLGPAQSGKVTPFIVRKRIPLHFAPNSVMSFALGTGAAHGICTDFKVEASARMHRPCSPSSRDSPPQPAVGHPQNASPTVSPQPQRLWQISRYSVNPSGLICDGTCRMIFSVPRTTISSSTVVVRRRSRPSASPEAGVAARLQVDVGPDGGMIGGRVDRLGHLVVVGEECPVHPTPHAFAEDLAARDLGEQRRRKQQVIDLV
jgi:hypothetical protein